MKRKSHKKEFTEACVSAVLHDFTMILKRTQVFLEAFEKSHDMNVRVIETVYIEQILGGYVGHKMLQTN
jgi:hypothetical protein